MVSAPLFEDPVYGSPTDPSIIWNREEKKWWIMYTQRRNSPHPVGASDVHGTKIGVASSEDGSRWLYRGTLPGLDIEPGHNTFWAPEVLYAEGKYHMFVSYITGIPTNWEWPRHILHYTADNMWEWKFEGIVPLSSERCIDACVFKVGDKYKMWYKDEDHESHSYAAESADLYHWTVLGDEISYNHHEGPNAFSFGGKNWMITDEWDGLGVYETADFRTFTRNGVILKEGGKRRLDGAKGHHADVLVNGGNAYIFYFCSAWNLSDGELSFETLPASERGHHVVQVAKLSVKEGKLCCDRDEEFELRLAPPEESF